MKIVLGGQLIDYKDEGKGKVIVLLHGWGNDKKSLDDLAAHLAKKYRVLRIDFPGFGGSPQPVTDWHIIDYAKCLHDTLAKLQIKNVYALVGHSFGGRVIIKSIAEKLVKPEKVILMGAAGVRPKDSARRLAYKVVAKTGKAVTALPGLRNMRDGLRKKLYTSAGAMDYYNAGSMRKIFQNTVNEDLLPYVHSITMPALLIWGEHDDEAPVDQARAMMGQLKRAELEVVKGAGHFVFDDAPEFVYKKIDGFLK